jgi:ribosomal protein S18 acetylase RimI-like enzyme
MKIIQATNKEITDIVRLNVFVQEIHYQNHPDIFKPIGNDGDVKDLFKWIISKENNYLFLAYKEAIPVGYSWVTFEDRPEFALKYGRKQAYIHQIAVHKNYRQQHIGQALFDEIEILAKKEGISHFELDSWAFNTDAHVFFKKMGFETYNIKMWRKSRHST